MKDSKDVYELLVSKFDYSVNEQDIKNHIIKNTGVNDDLFKLSKMKSNKETEINGNYVSFKVTTLHESDYRKNYRKIDGKRIWEPMYSVRDFQHDRSFKQNQFKRPKTMNWQANRNNQYVGRGNMNGNFVQRQRRLPPRFENNFHFRRMEPQNINTIWNDGNLKMGNNNRIN